jgi:hypothetical protein
MHINTTIHKELKEAAAWPTWAAMEWKTRQEVLTLMYSFASQTLIHTDGLVDQAECEVNRLTGSRLLAQAANRSLRKWAGNRTPEQSPQ